MPTRALLVLALFLLAAMPARADLTERYPHLRRGVLLVIDQVGSGGNMGTAFAVARVGTATFLVTNQHVIAASGTLGVLLEGSRQLVPVEVVARDAQADLALLRIEGLDAPILTLAPAGSSREGQKIAVIGYPRADDLFGAGMTEIKPSMTEGIVSAVRTRGQVPMLQTDASINPGNSGGPALDQITCNVVGVATSRLQDAEGIGLLVAVDAVHDLLRRNGVQPGGAPPVQPTASPGRTTGGHTRRSAPARAPTATHRSIPGVVILGLLMVGLLGLGGIAIASQRTAREDRSDDRPVL